VIGQHATGIGRRTRLVTPLGPLLLWLATGTVLFGVAILNPYGVPVENAVLGSVLVIAALVPLASWLAETNCRAIPLLAIHGLFYAICFGFAGLIRMPDEAVSAFNRVTDQESSKALWAGLLSWSMVLGGYTAGRRSSFSVSPQLLTVGSLPAHRVAAVLLYPLATVATIWALKGNRLEWQQVTHIIRLFVLLWVVHAAWSRRLPAKYRYLVLAGIVPVELFLFGGLAEGKLFGLLRYGQLLGMTYAVTHRRIPLALAVLVAVAFFVLQPAKADYRSAKWGAEAETLGAIEGLQTFVGMAWERLPEEVEASGTAELLETGYTRLNHLQTVALVIADTPSSQPYQYGATLLPLLTAWIPRAFWPDKPLEDLGNQWAREYGYVGITDFATSYNLNWLAEMYINGGWLGVAFLSLAVGALMGSIRSGLLFTDTGSPYHAFTLLIASAFFFPESNMSAQLGGALVSAVLGLLLIRLIRAFSRNRRTMPRPSASLSL
jgi:hypothetical protein